MVYDLVIGKSAIRDIENVLDWYAGESEKALKNFVKNLFDRFDDVQSVPSSFGVLRQKPQFRKVKVKKYPYFIIYRIDEVKSRIVIVALIHNKRNPPIWIKHLR